jgi:ABC-type branched-subunit amino acid transport system ATPase component
MLRIERLSVAYGKHEALHDVSLHVPRGRTTVILGANGAGKTTLLKTIAGLVQPQRGGRILFEDRAIENEPPHRMVAVGIALVPEGRRLFGEMTVIDNLRMGAYTPHARANAARQLERQLALFPRLAERRDQLARTMSGGEQQMLAIARALMSAPKLLLLDEPSLGLGPRLVKDLFAILAAIRRGGQSVVLVEQNVRQSLRVADQVYVLENGRVVRSGSATEIEDDAAMQKAYLGMATAAQVESAPRKTYSAGGFVNPFARTVAPVRASQDQESAMAHQLESSSAGSGFFHPFARSISPPTNASSQPAAAPVEPVAPPATRPENIPTTGGFVNPQARAAKQ